MKEEQPTASSYPLRCEHHQSGTFSVAEIAERYTRGLAGAACCRIQVDGAWQPLHVDPQLRRYIELTQDIEPEPLPVVTLSHQLALFLIAMATFVVFAPSTAEQGDASLSLGIHRPWGQVVLAAGVCGLGFSLFTRVLGWRVWWLSIMAAVVMALQSIGPLLAQGGVAPSVESFSRSVCGTAAILATGLLVWATLRARARAGRSEGSGRN